MKLLWHMPTFRRTSCGLSIRALNFAKRLQQRGHEIQFAVARDKTDCIDAEINGIPIRLLDVKRASPVHWSLQALQRQHTADDAVSQLGGPFDAFISCQPEAIVAFRRRQSSRSSASVVESSGAVKSIPVVFVCGGTTLLHEAADRNRLDAETTAFRRWTAMPAFSLDSFLKRRNERRAFHAADICIFDSESTKARVIAAYGIRQERCHALRGAVDTGHFRPATSTERQDARAQLSVADDEFLLAWTGRLSPEKNLDTLIHAMSRCANRRIRLILAGDGPNRGKLEKIVESMNAGSEAYSAGRNMACRVQFLRDVRDVRPLLHASDGFIFPSVSESLGLSLIEALACGLPAIALAADNDLIRNASAEILDQGRCGQLVSRNDADALAGAIDQLADDADRRAVLAESGRQRAMTLFDWAPSIDHFESLVTVTTCRSIEKASGPAACNSASRSNLDCLAPTQDQNRRRRQSAIVDDL